MVYGDLTGDGKIDIDDVRSVLSLSGQPVNAAILVIADLNADGRINSLDAKALTWICTKPKVANPTFCNN